MSLLRTWRAHWPEYLIEAWALGMFMLSAASFSLLLEYPGSPAHRAIEDADLRRALAGLAMGLTAICLIYSRWGKRSGAHMNPAVTLTFWRLGKVAGADALGYVAAQFVGGTIGVLVAARLAGVAFTAAPVSYAATMPGAGGAWIAFAAEVVISFGLMLTVLTFSNHVRLAPFTGLAAGVLVATYITIEAPYSGMSMNPARSFASAAPGGLWGALWIYFTAPLVGMLAAAQLYRRLPRTRVQCAKLQHPPQVRCIHCGYEPRKDAASAVTGSDSRGLQNV